MSNLIYLQRPRYNKEILPIIKMMKNIKIIICCDLSQYYFFKKNILNIKIKVMFLKQNIFQKIIKKFMRNVSKESILQIIFIELLGKCNYAYINSIVEKNNIYKIYTDFNFYDEFFLPLKTISKKKKVKIDLFYFFEEPVLNVNVLLNSLYYKKNWSVNIVIKFFEIFFCKKKIFAITKKYLISRYTLTQIFFISIFKIDVGNALSRLVFPIFDNIYCLNNKVKEDLEKKEKNNKSNILVITKKKINKKKYKFDFLFTTHPFTRHSLMKREDEYALNNFILKILKKHNRKILFYIHPNHYEIEKKYYTKLGKKYGFKSKIGGDFHKDISYAKVCISNFKSTVVTHCVDLNIPFISYCFPYNNTIFPNNIYYTNHFNLIMQKKTNKFKVFKNDSQLEMLIQNLSNFNKSIRYNSIINYEIVSKI